MTVFLRRATIQNYKSISRCRVELGSFTLLVGPNGSGKSNFLDALRLVAEGLNTTLEFALRDRGGIKEVRRKSTGHPTHFGISLDITLPDGSAALYAFRVGATPDGGFRVQRERAEVASADLLAPSVHFDVKDGNLVSASETLLAKVTHDRLYLTAVSASERFRPLFDTLSQIGVYNINPAALREPQNHDSGRLLQRDGRNIASVIKRMKEDTPDRIDRIQQYLNQIVPGIAGFDYQQLGPKETLEFRQDVPGAAHPWRFYASSMSDGTLRALGVLVALYQNRTSKLTAPPLVGIEEPESAINPGAAGILVDALFEASLETQVIVTTHSPDLIDHPKIGTDNILAVESRAGETFIAPVDSASVTAVRDRLYSVGELLRQQQIQPDITALPTRLEQAELFRPLMGNGRVNSDHR